MRKLYHKEFKGRRGSCITVFMGAGEKVQYTAQHYPRDDERIARQVEEVIAEGISFLIQEGGTNGLTAFVSLPPMKAAELAAWMFLRLHGHLPGGQ